MRMIDLRHISTNVCLTQSERLEAELRHTGNANRAQARRKISFLGNHWLLARNYDGRYVPELTKKGAA
ncbi:hypothetical protein [Burkholderia lata]|uniref:Uncharacterized protein n=1 Tax=Burkholderia lata (strain ATCC 17760 / DSM 23089 / LMG 22485 / NCIMB 9086 / R18194 / 383) TaxID=482957 RepID=A0A6P2GUP7_BURL3|nr:hypothetical protein [Burkholderia lata]VWB08238.1 hypothetical protein BLA6863_00207 [Burkholderia lata]